METALSTISALPSNKDQMVVFKRMLKDELLSGSVDPLKELVKLHFAFKSIDDVLHDEEVEAAMIREYNLYPAKEKVIVMGAELRQSEVGVKYQYENSGDPYWFELDKQIKELTEKRKEREKFLQNIPYDNGVVDPDTGVFITRPPKSSKSKIIVKL